MAANSPLRALLKQARAAIDESFPSDQPLEASPDALHGNLNEFLCAVTTARHDSPSIKLSPEEKGDLWHILNKLWVCPLHKPWIA